MCACVCVCQIDQQRLRSVTGYIYGKGTCDDCAEFGGYILIRLRKQRCVMIPLFKAAIIGDVMLKFYFDWQNGCGAGGVQGTMQVQGGVYSRLYGTCNCEVHWDCSMLMGVSASVTLDLGLEDICGGRSMDLRLGASVAISVVIVGISIIEETFSQPDVASLDNFFDLGGSAGTACLKSCEDDAAYPLISALFSAGQLNYADTSDGYYLLNDWRKPDYVSDTVPTGSSAGECACNCPEGKTVECHAPPQGGEHGAVRCASAAPDCMAFPYCGILHASTNPVSCSTCVRESECFSE